MEAAFPSRLRQFVPAVRARLEQTPFGPLGTIQRARRSWGDIVVDGETLIIPYRQYDRPLSSSGLAPEARLMWLAWLTRSNDGEVRQAAVRGLFERPDNWVAPFIIQLLGEYVIEISTDIAAFVDTTVVRDPAWTEVFRAFWAENPGFIELSRARAASYWSEYYRDVVFKQAEFPGVRAFNTLGKLAPQSP
jgi:hypothetical protein